MTIFWVEVKPANGPPEGFASGIPNKSKEIVETLKILQKGDTVTIRYYTDFERHRIQVIQKSEELDVDLLLPRRRESDPAAALDSAPGMRLDSSLISSDVRGFPSRTFAFIVLLVLGAEQQSDEMLVALFLQQIEGVFLRMQFLPVTHLEFLPFGRVVAEPFAEFGARGQIFEPQVHRGPLLRQAARPPRRSTRIRSPSFDDGSA